MNTKAYERMTLEQLQNTVSTMRKKIEDLQKQAGEANSFMEAKQLYSQLNDAENEKRQFVTAITKYLNFGEW